ncbi:uncharacterized protein LOC113360527 [Papaver somniferum]|uniref:uncharacterized protein LOC113360527 n=1 Tax=Papaver somniferum TaxID=3469 RepID=UPI000E702B93|nr:uncharacterized protein LOC113360527 [Papaver somniferum]
MDRNKSKPLDSSRSGMYVLSEEDDLNAKIASLHRKVDDIQKPNLVKVADSVEHACGICESMEHYTKDYPTIPSFQEVEKGTLPAQTQPNPKGQYEANNANIEQAKVVTTLRNGKVIETPMKVNEPEKSPKPKGGDCHSDTENENFDVDKKMHAPFPHRLLSTKPLADNKDILDILHVCQVHKGSLHHQKEEQCAKKGIPHGTGNFVIKQALLDLGASVNLLPFSVYEQLGLGELKPTPVTLQLADRLVKVAIGVVEDVLVQIDKFYYPVDFIILDTQPVVNASNEIPIILGRPFLATANALINCPNDIMNLSFGNMTVELKIFDTCKYPSGGDDIHEVSMIETIVQEKLSYLEAKDALEASLLNLLDFDEDGSIEEVNSLHPHYWIQISGGLNLNNFQSVRPSHYPYP